MVTLVPSSACAWSGRGPGGKGRNTVLEPLSGRTSYPLSGVRTGIRVSGQPRPCSWKSQRLWLLLGEPRPAESGWACLPGLVRDRCGPSRSRHLSGFGQVCSVFFMLTCK